MSQKEKEMNQGAAKAESENLEAEQVQAENGETSAGTEKQEAETKETEKETKESEAKDAKKDPKDAQIEELQDRLKSQMAELIISAKRTEKEKGSHVRDRSEGYHREDPSGVRQLRERPGSRAGG